MADVGDMESKAQDRRARLQALRAKRDASERKKVRR